MNLISLFLPVEIIELIFFQVWIRFYAIIPEIQ